MKKLIVGACSSFLISCANHQSTFVYAQERGGGQGTGDTIRDRPPKPTMQQVTNYRMKPLKRRPGHPRRSRLCLMKQLFSFFSSVVSSRNIERDKLGGGKHFMVFIPAELRSSHVPSE